jgi:hypothetical protein
MPVDLLLGSNFDLLIVNGDFVIGEATRQQQQILLLLEKGENRQYPTMGVGLSNWLNDDKSSGNVVAEIKKNFEGDGMNVIAVKIEKGCIVTEAVYE